MVQAASTPYDNDEILRLREENFRRRSTHNFPDECCLALRREILEAQTGAMFGTPEPEGPPQIFIIIGPPASGKSTIANEIKQSLDVKIVDSDEIKSRLPEFSKGHHARVVHEESSLLNGEVLEKALEQRVNVIYPVVGRKSSVILSQAFRFNAYGYDVHLYCKHISPDKAAQRAVLRFITGEIDSVTQEIIHRFVDPLYILEEVRDLPLRTYIEIRNNDIFKTRKLITE
jgi:AAA+ ATPase superfamily predicted ATPase